MSLAYTVLEALELTLVENVSSRFDRKCIYFDILTALEETEELIADDFIDASSDEPLIEAWEELHPEDINLETRDEDVLNEDEDDLEEYWSQENDLEK